MIGTAKISSRSGAHIGRQILIYQTMIILLLQIIVTSEGIRLWSPQVYSSFAARVSKTSQSGKNSGRPSLAPHTKAETQIRLKPDVDKKALMQQRLSQEQHLLHAGMNSPPRVGSPPRLAPLVNPETQIHAKRDTIVKLSMQKKLMNEQRLLHAGMHGHPLSPARLVSSGSVPQISPPKKQAGQLLNHAEITQFVQNVAHEILLPTLLPPSTSTANSPTCDSAPHLPPGQNPPQIPGQNPVQTPTQNPEGWPTNQPSSGEGSSKPETVTGPSDGGKKSAICYSRPAPGICQGAFKRYYYNVTLDQCDCYFFGGCEDRARSVSDGTGGQTILVSLEQCIQSCSPGNRQPGPRCRGALTPPIFFLDPSDQAQRDGSEPRGVEDRNKDPVVSSPSP